MMRDVGLKLGVSCFWKTEVFNEYFRNFSRIFLCFVFLLKSWLCGRGLLLISCHFRDLTSKIVVFASVYKIISPYKKKQKPARFNLITKDCVWVKSENPRQRKQKLNRLGLLSSSFRRFSSTIYDSSRKVKEKTKLFFYPESRKNIFKPISKIIPKVAYVHQHPHLQHKNVDLKKWGFFHWKSTLLRKLKFKKWKYFILTFMRKFKYFLKKSISFKFKDIFNKPLFCSSKFRRMKPFIVSTLYPVLFDKIKNMEFFFPGTLLKKISRSIFRKLNSRWFLWRRFFGICDLINVLNLSFFFFKADIFMYVFCCSFLKEKKNFVVYLKRLKSLMKAFALIYCYRYQSRSYRIGVFGKIGLQKKRKRKTFYISVGKKFPAKTIGQQMDYAFQGIWNFAGSFGVKIWIFGAQGGVSLD